MDSAVIAHTSIDVSRREHRKTLIAREAIYSMSLGKPTPLNRSIYETQRGAVENFESEVRLAAKKSTDERNQRLPGFAQTNSVENHGLYSPLIFASSARSLVTMPH